MPLSDFTSQVGTQPIQIITVDPRTRRVEGRLRDGAVIQVAVWNAAPFFRWPREGEIWTVNYSGGYPVLGEYDEQQDAKYPVEDMNPGDARIDARYLHVNAPAVFRMPPTAPTVEEESNNTVLATTEFVNRAVTTGDTALGEEIDLLEDGLDSLGTDLDALELDLETLAQDTQADIDAINLDITTIEGDIDAIETEIAGFDLANIAHTNVNEQITGEWTFLGGIGVHNPAASPTTLSIQSSAGQQANIYLSDAGALKWQIGKAGDNSFYIWDQVNARSALTISGSGTNVVLPGTLSVGDGTTRDSYLTLFGGAEIYRTAAQINNHALRVWSAAEPNPRFILQGDGKLYWGPGSGGVDATLERSGTGALTLTGGLSITGGAVIGSTTTSLTLTAITEGSVSGGQIRIGKGTAADNPALKLYRWTGTASNYYSWWLQPTASNTLEVRSASPATVIGSESTSVRATFAEGGLNLPSGSTYQINGTDILTGVALLAANQTWTGINTFQGTPVIDPGAGTASGTLTLVGRNGGAAAPSSTIRSDNTGQLELIGGTDVTISSGVLNAETSLTVGPSGGTANAVLNLVSRSAGTARTNSFTVDTTGNLDVVSPGTVTIGTNAASNGDVYLKASGTSGDMFFQFGGTTEVKFDNSGIDLTLGNTYKINGAQISTSALSDVTDIFLLTNSQRIYDGSLVVRGHASFKSALNVSFTKTPTAEVHALCSDNATTTWAASGTQATQRANLFDVPTFASSVATRTLTSAATVAIAGAPIAGTGVAITNSYALWVQGGLSYFQGDINTTGQLQVNGTAYPSPGNVVTTNTNQTVSGQKTISDVLIISGTSNSISQGLRLYNSAATSGSRNWSQTVAATGEWTLARVNDAISSATHFLTVSGTKLLANNINIDTTGQYQVNGVQISTANLSDSASIAHVNAAETVSAAWTFSSFPIVDVGSGTNDAMIYLRGRSSGNVREGSIKSTSSGMFTLDSYAGYYLNAAASSFFEFNIGGTTEATINNGGLNLSAGNTYQIGGTSIFAQTQTITADWYHRNQIILNSSAGDSGGVGLVPGSSTQSGYLQWHKGGTQQRLAYFGFDNTDLTLTLENGAQFLVNATSQASRATEHQAMNVWHAGATFGATAPATQRYTVFNTPGNTTAAAAQTVTTAATVAIAGAPPAGTNVTITNSYALWVQSGKTRLDGDVDITGTFAASNNYGTSLPASPREGQIYHYNAAPGVVWTFRYNAASVHAYKWEYVGGTDIYVQRHAVDTKTGMAVGTWYDVPNGPQLTIPLVGDYQFVIEATVQWGFTGHIAIGLWISGSDLTYHLGSPVMYGVGGENYTMSFHFDKTISAANSTGTMRIYQTGVGGAAADVRARSIRAHPIRVQG